MFLKKKHVKAVSHGAETSTLGGSRLQPCLQVCNKVSLNQNKSPTCKNKVSTAQYFNNTSIKPCCYYQVFAINSSVKKITDLHTHTSMYTDVKTKYK